MCRSGRVWETGLVHPYVERLVELGLPVGDWALTGSGPLLLRGWIDDVGDLDVISRGSAWEIAERHGQFTTLANGVQIIEIGPRVTVGRTWPYGDATVDEMIDTAEMVRGVPCVHLDHIVTYKQILDRPKDREHLSIIERNRRDASPRS